MYNNGFVRLRKGLKEHINRGLMSGEMLSVYTYLHLHADYSCGIVWNTSAPYIARDLKYKTSFTNRILRKLEQKEYIKRIGHIGQKMSYEIILNKFLTPNGILIDAVNSKSVNKLAWTLDLNVTLSESQMNLKCISNVFQVSPYKEIKNIKTYRNKEGENLPLPEMDKKLKEMDLPF